MKVINCQSRFVSHFKLTVVVSVPSILLDESLIMLGLLSGSPLRALATSRSTLRLFKSRWVTSCRSTFVYAFTSASFVTVCFTLLACLSIFFAIQWWPVISAHQSFKLGVGKKISISHLLQNLRSLNHLVTCSFDQHNGLGHVVWCWEELFEQWSDMLLTVLNQNSARTTFTNSSGLILQLRQSYALGPDQDSNDIATDDVFALSQHFSFFLGICLRALL